jgi:hypothetical protein
MEACVVYGASIRSCHPCPLREQCQWQENATTKPRQVSVLLLPRTVGSAPLRLRETEAAESTDGPVCNSCVTSTSGQCAASRRFAAHCGRDPLPRATCILTPPVSRHSSGLWSMGPGNSLHTVASWLMLDSSGQEGKEVFFSSWHHRSHLASHTGRFVGGEAGDRSYWLIAGRVRCWNALVPWPPGLWGRSLQYGSVLDLRTRSGQRGVSASDLAMRHSQTVDPIGVQLRQLDLFGPIRAWVQMKYFRRDDVDEFKQDPAEHGLWTELPRCVVVS